VLQQQREDLERLVLQGDLRTVPAQLAGAQVRFVGTEADIGTFTATGAFVDVGVQPESLILSPGERTLIVSLRGTPARLAFVDTATLTLSATLDIAGAGTQGDLAVASPDGRYVYATFDAFPSGQGGVAKVDAVRRTLVDTFPYPDIGRPHGIAYVRGRTRHR
jgi:hypothetical protein